MPYFPKIPGTPACTSGAALRRLAGAPPVKAAPPPSFSLCPVPRPHRWQHRALAAGKTQPRVKGAPAAQAIRTFIAGAGRPGATLVFCSGNLETGEFPQAPRPSPPRRTLSTASSHFLARRTARGASSPQDSPRGGASGGHLAWLLVAILAVRGAACGFVLTAFQDPHLPLGPSGSWGYRPAPCSQGRH